MIFHQKTEIRRKGWKIPAGQSYFISRRMCIKNVIGNLLQQIFSYYLPLQTLQISSLIFFLLPAFCKPHIYVLEISRIMLNINMFSSMVTIVCAPNTQFVWYRWSTITEQFSPAGEVGSLCILRMTSSTLSFLWGVPGDVLVYSLSGFE